VVKIKDERLEQIYNFDALLLGSVEEICVMFDNLLNLSAQNQETVDAESKVLAALTNLINKFDEREAALRTL
jgi:hypothetical protein